MSDRMSIDDYVMLNEQRMGALSRALGILTASLHSVGLVNGRAVARSMRLDKGHGEAADEFMDAMADMVERTIDLNESEGPHSLKPV